MATGWLIRPDLLVTAGHCAYDWNLGRATEVKAYIGYNGKASVGTSNVQFRSGAKVVITGGWLRSRENRRMIWRSSNSTATSRASTRSLSAKRNEWAMR